MGLTALYDSLQEKVLEAIDLREQVLRHSDWWPRRRLVITFWRLNPTAKVPEALRSKMLQRAAGHHAQDPLVDKVTAVYWVEELANHLRTTFSLGESQVRALKTVHEARQSALVGVTGMFRLRTLVGVVIAAIGFVAAQVPSETFKELGWPHAYGWYRLGLFVLLVVLVLYAMALSLPTRRPFQRLLYGSTITGLVLSICEARPDADEDAAPAAP
jgi:hypothetical protein